MTEILQVRTKMKKAEAILFDGTNAQAIVDTLPVNSWKVIGDVYHIFDDVYDGYQTLTKGQYVVMSEVDGAQVIEVFDGPVFWDKYDTRVRMRPGAAFELRQKSAELASTSIQGAAVLPNTRYLINLASEIENYIKGDDYE